MTNEIKMTPNTFLHDSNQPGPKDRWENAIWSIADFYGNKDGDTTAQEITDLECRWNENQDQQLTWGEAKPHINNFLSTVQSEGKTAAAGSDEIKFYDYLKARYTIDFETSVMKAQGSTANEYISKCFLVAYHALNVLGVMCYGKKTDVIVNIDCTNV